jgi:hypothetical protein
MKIGKARCSFSFLFSGETLFLKLAIEQTIDYLIGRISASSHDDLRARHWTKKIMEMEALFLLTT